MKVAVIGAGGTRTPLLVRGLAESGLPIERVALYDLDASRLRAMASVAAQYAGPLKLEPCDRSTQAIENADYVLFSIRAGGERARARDERAALDCGVVAQETVGASGFAMALRSIPPLLEYAREVERLAPGAVIVNFTNPVSIVTQALTSYTRARVVGICDTPTELFEATALVLGLDSRACFFDYFGLNHLGWLREVYYQGVPQLHRVWEGGGFLDRIYRAPIFTRATLDGLRMLPTEYLYFYYSPEDAVAHMKRAGETRGEALARMNARLFADLGEPSAQRVGGGAPTQQEKSVRPATATYETYLRARESSYLEVETGTSRGDVPPWVALAGYEKMAMRLLRAIHFDEGAVMPLDVPNRGNLSDLESEDVVEVPSVVNRSGVFPLHVPPVPFAVRDLLIRVKRYERETVAAALSMEKESRIAALALHPLVGDRDLSRRVLEAMGIS